jgi:hypothetical protein
MSEEKKEDPQLGRSYLIDSVLVDVITTVERLEKSGSDEDTHLSLIVGGSIVSGRVVSHFTWANSLNHNEGASEEQSQPTNPEGEQTEAKAGEDDAPQEEPATEPEDHERRFIHLLDARMIVGGRFVPSQGPGIAWRIKLASVDGFSLDTLSSKKDQQEGEETVESEGGSRTITVGNVRIIVPE